MGDVNLEELYSKSVENERQLIELEMIGGKKSAEFYKKSNISYYILKSALLSGYSIDKIKDAYDEYCKDKKIQSIVTFDGFMNIAVVTRI